ncbi:fumarylacetoacetase [Micromonospora endophytica]|uniref:fumarylacetoacetase n=1 Tax=Micromonospora endophytica TaxID=515350 RepID=A0A2W2CHG5_9ACTN|nr:fumarylacetoacetase [Micromonospora endophytica]PZF98845.1 fumarylacetoacetase [Micromonospora endophytica]RIW46588.1 fumarylacetoacetase [Micromonospora endophytica]BCJ59886.1 fumarylacetoacetase [Micromonospora endophytica]
MTWVTSAQGSGYGVEHLPYGVFRVGDGAPRIGVRIGDLVFDLAGAEAADLVLAGGALALPTLNTFLALGRPQWMAVRQRITELLTESAHRAAVEPLLVPLDEVQMELPFEVADYVDFYSSEQHASNVGQIFRPGQPPLLPNWKHLPIGYHGRAGTVVVSGTPVVRPQGQRPGPDGPVYGPSARLDIEAEVGFVVGVPSPLGSRVAAADFADHVFGVVLVNDWSARDIQAWEYQPLGPFLGKSFATSVAAWVTPLDALRHAFVPAPDQDPPVAGYLRDEPHLGLDLRLTVNWNGEPVSEPPFAGMYWTPAQQLAHLTVNGASLRTGDLYASGTVSGPRRDQVGSFLELTWGGAEPITVAGAERTFLADGDTVTITATAPGPDGGTITLGEVTGLVLPAR